MPEKPKKPASNLIVLAKVQVAVSISVETLDKPVAGNYTKGRC